jgi:transcriptional antiterminator Rof (Rho-off)
MIFLNEQPKPPSYLTTKFIEAALRKKHPKIHVIDINIVPAVSPGENYICTVFRVHVSTNEGPFSLIIKCVRDSHFNMEFNASNCYTQKEGKFYSSFIPLFDSSIQPNVPLCYDVIKDGDIDCIMLKDMSREGYQVYNRLKGFDKIHCEIVLKELAKLHALSLKLRIEDPEMFKSKAINQFQKPKQTEKYGALKISKKILSKYSQDIRECYPFRYHSI